MKTQNPFFLQVLFLACAFLITTTAFADLEDRNVGHFDVLKINGPMDVFITQSKDYEVRVEAPIDRMKNIETKVEGGALVVQYKSKRGRNNWSWKSMKGIKVYVSVRDLEGLFLSGSGDVEGSGLRAKQLKLNISGSGDIDLEVDAHKINTKISGSGDIDLIGSAERFDITISGSGDIDAFGLKTEECEVVIYGSGDCDVNVSQYLDVRINGSGNVTYKGNPVEVNQKVSGSGGAHKH